MKKMLKSYYKKVTIAASLLLVAAISALGGCASYAQSPEYVKARSTTLPSGWRVDCSTDAATGVRKCFAAKFSHGNDPFQVYYYGKSGPYLMAGFQNDPISKAIIRVDGRSPIFLTSINRYSYNATSAAHKRDASKAVRFLKYGNTAVIRYYRFPGKSRTFRINLDGFNEAHSLLLSKL